MDLLEAVDIGYRYLIRGNSNHIAILLVQVIDEEDAAPAYDGFLEWQSCEAGPEGTRDIAKR
jgi:hypothetical protein